MKRYPSRPRRLSRSIRPALRFFALYLVLCTLALETSAQRTPDEAPPGEPTAAFGSEQGAGDTQLMVHLELIDTDLIQGEIHDVLTQEFRCPVSFSENTNGLNLKIQAKMLSASFKTEDGSTVQRQMELPEDRAQQLTTIALLSGSIARDETGALIALLSAPVVPTDPSEPAPVSASTSKEAAEAGPSKITESRGSADNNVPKSGAPDQGSAPTQEEKKEKLPETFGGLSLVGNFTLPKNLHHKTAHMHLGFLSSDIGSLRGIGATLGIHLNRGNDPQGSGIGVQAAGVYLQNGGDFNGVSASLLVANTQGRFGGVLGAGLVTINQGDLHGVQLSGLASIGIHSTSGVQLAGLSSHQSGNTEGAQVAGLSSFTGGNLLGFQGAGLFTMALGKVHGTQISLLYNYGQRGLHGFQGSLVNLAPGGMNGAFQLGIVNVAGDFKGTQIGIVNIGGVGEGNQVGLINIAKDLKGAAIAPINIIPGIRNQLLAYSSYFPSKSREGTPNGPLYHLAVKFVPGTIYTQLGFALGAESKECVDDSNGQQSCYGGGVVYAPSFALGARSKLSKLLHIDLDLQYQFVRGFNQSRSMLHQVLGRAALGMQLASKAALFVGGGPRLDIYEGPRVSPSPEVGYGWHLFGGAAFF